MQGSGNNKSSSQGAGCSRQGKGKRNNMGNRQGGRKSGASLNNSGSGKKNISTDGNRDSNSEVKFKIPEIENILAEGIRFLKKEFKKNQVRS